MFGTNIISRRQHRNKRPAPLDWSSITYCLNFNKSGLTSQRIQGVDFVRISISLSAGCADTLPDMQLYYHIGEIPPTTDNNGRVANPRKSTSGFTRIRGNTSPITVYNNMWLSFAAYGLATAPITTVSVRNVSLNLSLLDTFLISVTNC
jgi:hypothetical protein